MADPIQTGTIGQSPAFALPREGTTASRTGFHAAHLFGKYFVRGLDGMLVTCAACGSQYILIS